MATWYRWADHSSRLLVSLKLAISRSGLVDSRGFQAVQTFTVNLSVLHNYRIMRVVCKCSRHL
jgi:hypothetical protein